MSKYFVLALVALCVATTSAARIPRADPAGTAAPLADLMSNVESTMSRLHSSFLELFGVKDNEALIGMVTDKSTGYVNELRKIYTDVSAEAAKNVSPASEKLKELVKTGLDGLDNISPELKNDSKKLQEYFETHLNGLLADSKKFQEKLAVESEPALERLKKLSQDLYSTTVNTATAYTKEVEKTLKETH